MASKSVSEFIAKVAVNSEFSNVELYQGQWCSKRDNSSNKFYNLLIYKDTDTNVFRLCKMYGPYGKWTAWTIEEWINRQGAEAAYDTELAKRRSHGYTDHLLDKMELDHAQIVFRALIRLHDIHSNSNQSWSLADYGILRSFVENLRLTKQEMMSLNFTFKQFQNT